MDTRYQEISYGWQNCPKSVRSKVNDILNSYRQAFGEDLVGFYLHGSLAMDCFNPRLSDIDLLAVVRCKLTLAAKKAIIDYLLSICDIHVEMSIVTIKSVKNMEYPTPFELHYNYDHREQYESGKADLTVQRYDEDLLLHFEVIRQRGICLFGTPIEEMFPKITKEKCITSITNELDWINEKFNTLPTIYIVLNPRRAIAFLKEGAFMSKKEGGKWALANLPARFSDTIGRALAVYTGAEDIGPYNDDILHDIIEYTRREIAQFSTGQIIK